MRIKQSCMVFALAVSCAATYADPLDVKPGLWEITTTTAMSGMPPIDTSQMTPEQKSRFEAAMKAREAQGPRVHVRKSCVTKEKLAHEPFQEKDEETCKHTVISRTGSHWQSKISCTKPKRVGDFNIEAVSREHIKGGVQMKASGHSHEVTIRISIDGKWLDSNCGNIQ